MSSNKKIKSILWWGRFDPNYSRNRILREILLELDYKIVDFLPKSSITGGLESRFKSFENISAVWVPAFRQRDHRAARNFAYKRNIPLIFDPLISAWDKVVFERQKYSSFSFRGKRLKHWEQQLFNTSDLVLADTPLHAQFFIDELEADKNKTCVVPVGAEESLFVEQVPKKTGGNLEVLFYGSFINLQAPEVIVEAARLVPDVKWVLLGDGPLRKTCEEKSEDLTNVSFEDWLSYKQLPGRIGKADLLMGVFGKSRKAGRVIPNKVFQSLACGRPVITRSSAAYPKELLSDINTGVSFVPPCDPIAIAECVKEFAGKNEAEQAMLGRMARKKYVCYFSKDTIKSSLKEALSKLSL